MIKISPLLIHTYCRFFPIPNVAKGRKRWILSVPVRGQLWLDAGAVRAVRDKHKSLFAPGITKVTGEFHVQDAVQLCDDTGAELARALVNFSSEDLDKIVKGRLWRSSDMEQPLGYGTMEEVAHRGNITLLLSSSSSVADEDSAAIAAIEDAAPAAGATVSHALCR
ncbi:hypothetical protein CEUSTIGMA_g2629.t1 [Chlamydomonas eustigma]|uniref:PUA domain-containing protein n=1 Tax=Chlamydomonas eustigma TaxID=1157962 RepID=A0A250WWL3_9CHLO|nr:hypothetical protein CEUSTIGMA_g2629.t1 [Chlamydomonas eustigma]|eukprot:GAX75185.1 hypothetical protein CEUSTIGMA_g2629.t1 [Chlamydomonas eustigma]